MKTHKITFDKAILSGWAGAYHGPGLIVAPRSVEDCCEVIDYAHKNNLTISLRGAGCTFGDAIVNTDGIVVDMTKMQKIIDWQPKIGRLKVEAGVCIADILRLVLPDQWVLAAVPGSLKVTVGGALSNNVHGKDSCCRGNFGHYVISITMLTANCILKTVSRDNTPDLFQAVIGGLGLLGIILSAELQLVPIPSPMVEVETKIANSMEETLSQLELSTERDYGQVWLDAYPRGKNFGRSFTKLAKYIPCEEGALDKAEVEKSLKINTHILGMPAHLVWHFAKPLLMDPFMRFTNLVYYNKAVLTNYLHGVIKKQLFSKFYFFHNNIPDFYSVYRPPGFWEMQIWMPLNNAIDSFSKFLRLAQRLKVTPVLSGMKRHLPDDFMISFNGQGYSMSMDFPLQGKDRIELNHAMQSLFHFVAENNGKANLSKDERLTNDVFQKMYPRAKEFWALKTRIDPTHIFMSDMSRRLFL